VLAREPAPRRLKWPVKRRRRQGSGSRPTRGRIGVRTLWPSGPLALASVQGHRIPRDAPCAAECEHCSGLFAPARTRPDLDRFIRSPDETISAMSQLQPEDITLLIPRTDFRDAPDTYRGSDGE
jgi:hypothetical protein